jgi:hypothetical protein
MVTAVPTVPLVGEKPVISGLMGEARGTGGDAYRIGHANV